MTRKISREQKRIDWVNNFESGRRWFDTLKTEKTGSIHTQIAFAKGLKLFCDYINLSPDELIRERKADQKSEDEQVKRRAEGQVRQFFIKLSENGLSRASARIFHSAVKSFYAANYYPLQSKTPPVMFEERRPVSIEELRKIDGITDARERALIRFLKDCGMSREDVAELQYNHVQKEFEEGKEFIYLRVVRRKAQIRYETFIGREAVEALRNYFDMRRISGETITPTSALFASVSKSRKPLTAKTLTTFLMRIGEKVGINLSPHRIRKYFETRMALGKVHPLIIKYWMGHKVKGGTDVEASYIIPNPEEQRMLYMEAYDNIALAVKPEIDELQVRWAMLKERARQLGHDPMTIFKRKKKETASVSEQVELLERELGHLEGLTARRGKRKETRPNGGNPINCQKIVEENELPGMLSQGWRFVATLNSGKTVIERNGG